MSCNFTHRTLAQTLSLRKIQYNSILLTYIAKVLINCRYRQSPGITRDRQSPARQQAELWPKLGDGVLNKAAYRSGWKPA
jgi:hypothetical protein